MFNEHGEITYKRSQHNIQEEFEDTKGVSESVNRRRTENTIAKRKRTNGETTIHKLNLKIE
jgi:hypothetical protein